MSIEKSEKFEIEKNKLLSRIGRNVKQLRINHKYTQEYVADKIGVHLNTYQIYESKKPYNIKIYNLYLIAEFYHITIDSLLK